MKRKLKIQPTPAKKICTNFVPFWNETTKNISEILWLPNPDSKNSSNTNMIQDQNSWFTTTSKKIIDVPDVLIALQRYKEPSTKIDLKAQKLRIYPTREQKLILNKFFGAARWVYNKSLNSIKTKQSKISKNELCSKFVHNKNFINENKWMNEIPYEVRNDSLRDLLKNYKSNFSKNKDTTSSFDMKFKSKKSPCHSLCWQKRFWNNKSGYFKPFKEIKCEQILPLKLEHDARIAVRYK